MGAAESVPQTSIHEFTVKGCRGRDVDLSIYKGKILLVINVASKCGFTTIQLKQLTELHKKYKDRGFEILAFPCNQFLKQSPGSSEQQKKFACERFKAEYPIFHKVCVNGPKTAEVFKFLKASTSKSRWTNRIKWNFTKFLLDTEGKVVKRTGLLSGPLELEDDIIKLLAEREKMMDALV